jgi:hypothetical protein
VAVDMLEDIIQELADQLGIFGGCPHGSGECPDCDCRQGWEARLKHRINQAVRAETRLTDGVDALRELAEAVCRHLPGSALNSSQVEAVIRHKNMNLPQCPHCGHEFSDHWLVDSSPELTVANNIRCPGCGESFICEATQEVRYVTRPATENDQA